MSMHAGRGRHDDRTGKYRQTVDIAMNTALDEKKDFLLVRIWDYLFVFLIVALTALGRDAFAMAAVPLVIPLVMQFFVPGRTLKYSLRPLDLMFIILTMQYFVWHWIIAGSYPLVSEPIPVRWIETPQAWQTGFIAMALVIWRFTMMRDVKTVWRTMAPAGLILAFLLLSLDYFTDFRGSECRVSGFVFNPLLPPVFITIFTIGSFFGWKDFSKGERLLRYGLVVMAVIVATAYSGARMVLLVQILTFGLLSLVLPVKDMKERALSVGLLGALGVIGVGIGLGFDILADCSFAKRLGQLAEVSNGATVSGQNTVDIRLGLVKQAIATIAQNPWTGFGISAEKLISAPEYHIHNQYFSWLIWGGIVSLVSGVAFLISASIAPLSSRSRDGLILVIAATGVLAVNSISDSLLYHLYANIEYILVLGLFYGLGRASWADQKNDQSGPGANAEAL